MPTSLLALDARRISVSGTQRMSLSSTPTASTKDIEETGPYAELVLSFDDATSFCCHTLAGPFGLIASRPMRTWLADELDRPGLSQREVDTPFDLPTELTWDVQPPPPQPTSLPLRLRATGAVAFIMDVLSLTETRVAELVGVSRNSVRNWRNGQDAYPATVARLLEISSTLTALDARLGRSGLVTWLSQPSSQGAPRREILAVPDGPAALAREAGRILFGKPPSNLPPAHLLGVDEPHEQADEPYRPVAFTARPRRRRPGGP